VPQSFKSFENGFEKGSGYCLAEGETSSQRSLQPPTYPEAPMDDVNEYLERNFENQLTQDGRDEHSQALPFAPNQVGYFDHSKNSVAQHSSQGHSRSLSLLKRGDAPIPNFQHTQGMREVYNLDDA
jgi:hypothetical protein